MSNKLIKEDWGSSDQAAMNKSIHRDAGSPKTMPSPFDKKLRSAAEDAVDFYWDDWEEYKNDRDELIDNAIRSYLRAYFKDQFNLMVRMFEGKINEGQFSWMTHDTGEQIGSERQNRITVFMYDNQGNKWKESKYDGYGEFGGKDYYELLAQMNGVENPDRQDGIDLAFNDKKVKAGEVLFPALVTTPNYNWKRHDFTQEAENDPNQSWYQEDYDDDDEYYESVVTEARAVKRFDKKLIDDKFQVHQEGALRTIYKGVTGNVDMEVSEKWIEMKGLRDLPEDYRGQHLGRFYELKKNLYLWATDMEDAKTGRPARDSRGDAFFNVMAIFTMDGDEILTLWERPSNFPVGTHGGPGVGFQYESVVTEGRVSYPRGKQYRISARFGDRDDQNTFAETYGLGKQSSNFARAFANEEELVEIVKDLKNVYGLENRDITLHIKGKNGDYDFWKIDSQNLKRHLSSDLLSKLSEFVSESLHERHITVKRQYTENYPAIKVGKSAKIRNKVIEAVKDGKLTKEEFDAVLREMTVDSTRWIRRNATYFNVNEDGITLSKTGKRILAELSGSEVNEKVTPFKLANVKAEEIFGEFGIATLDYDQLSRVIDIKLADKLAKKYGESSFISLTELDMEELLNKNPKLVKENKTQDTTMKNKLVFENFSDFVNSLNITNESVEMVNEAFKSSLLASLFTNKYGKFDKSLASAFYGTAKVKMDLIEDEDLLTMDPQTAYKNKQADTIIFYISDNEKENPHAPYDAYSDYKTIPGGGYLLAVASGENAFYTTSWTGGRWSSSKRELALKKTDNNSSDSIGISKKYKGWDGTGLYNVKRIAEVSDRAIVLNMALLRQKYSSEGERMARAAAKKGAVAFQTDKEFKSANIARYQEILANKAAALPLDKMVADAIETLTKQIKDGLAEGKKGKYGDVIIGTKKNGSEAKMRDAANHMSNILDDYNRYVSYIVQAEESEKRYGQKESYYERESKNYAKSVKDKIDQIEGFDYVW